MTSEPNLEASAPDDAPKRVPGLILRMILEEIQGAAGTQYARVLEQAELTRYAEAPPPADQSPTITEPALSRLYGATFKVIGESLTRLFLTNYGRRLPEALLASPAGQQMQAEAQTVPADKRLGAAVRLIAETGTRLWTPMRLLEDSEAYYLEISRCAICADIVGARAPICGNSEIVYTALARALSGVRVTALEVECAAAGGKHCRYRIRK
jgi:hypothetical protein